MPKNKKGHLTFDDRCTIEEGLKDGLSFRAIAREIEVSTTTVSNEIKKNRYFTRSKAVFGLSATRCAHFATCEVIDLCHRCSSRAAACKRCKVKPCFELCRSFERHVCQKLAHAPFVCTHCSKRAGCSFDKAHYKASKAHAVYSQRLSQAHIGVGCSEVEMRAMVSTVRKLLSQGHSLEAIWAVHKDELPVCSRTFYNYMDKGIMGLSNMELPRKVRYRTRKSKEEEHVARHDMAGRTYADWKTLSFTEQMLTVQMDCVEGKRTDTKVILSLHFVRFQFQLYILLDRHTQACVLKALDDIELACGDTFTELMPYLLPDRGSEFLDFTSLEASVDGDKVRTQVYYCDPVKPGQKGSAEKNHEELRKILPKGMFCFDLLTQEDVSLVCSHVNSYPRRSLGGKTPYDLASQVLPKSLLERLGVVRIAPDDVIMKPHLIQID